MDETKYMKMVKWPESVAEQLAIVLAMDDASVKINFLRQIALTGHPVTQADVDNLQQEARAGIIRDAIEKGYIKEETYP